MMDRIEEELDLLRTAYADLEHREDGGAQWVRIRSYPVPEGWSESAVEVAFQIPASPGQAPYAFRVRPGLHLNSSEELKNYTYPAGTPWGDDWGQFSWSPAEEWVPKTDIRAGSNMLNFARSFAARFKEGA